ncbi:MAG TPA: hypothetical protein VGN57_00100 [Pirellulaceae bacterium]|nr:hypothetical protein [Pirellulaceae bacterium]
MLGGIGSLAVHPRWRSILPLGEEQSATLIELDNLVREGRAIALQEAADHPAEDYASYKSYVDRIQARQSQAIGHARRIVEIGLLTESQRNLIDLRNEWSDFEWLSLKSGRAQDLLDLTKDQRRKLEDVYEEFSAREGTWEIWNPNDQVRQEARLARSAFRDRIEAKAREILTPEQAERWSKFVAERTLPAEPPELPACSDANSKLVSIQVTEDSPIFRVLKKHPPSYLGITPYQKRLVDDLAEVTQNGLLWIELERCRHKADDAESENSGAAAKKKSGELMHAAEQVALVGVLSPQQAERIEKLAQEEED